MDLRVTGAQDVEAFSRRMKEAGNKGLRRELSKALGHEMKPITANVVRSLDEYLPDAYAGTLSGSLKLRAATTAGKNPGVKIVARAKGRKSVRRVGALERGSLRHLTWGRRPWHAQSVKPGFFTEPIQDRADELRRALLAAMDRIARKIARR